ncbi:MAG: ABC transporter permease [Nitriliruptorales bacterium]|nr:ABC transporter permease [Nitriliruptorales bacterium]
MRSLRERLAELWRARELLAQFTRKELKVRYKNSTLGFLWSLLSPALMTVVFTVIFGFVLPIDVVDYAAFFLSAYLMWQFFQNSIFGSINSIVGNGDLIRKVWFPREVLPLSHVLAQLVHFLLGLLVIVPYLVVTRGTGVLVHLPAVALGIALLTVFTAGVAMIFASANVPFRDLQELVNVIFLVWFYATPVVYPLALVTSKREDIAAVATFGWLLDVNPMTWFVRLFRDALYGTVTMVPDTAAQFESGAQAWPEPAVLAVCALFAAGTFIVGYRLFNRLALTFAKEV